MELWKAIVVAIVQGLTEWLPVSSSGHLVLVERFLDLNVGLDFDVALHLGTLMAVFVYFGRDIVDITKALVSGKWKSEEGKLGLYILVATIPAAVIGFLFRGVFEAAFESLLVVGVGFAVTSMVLFIASMSFGGYTKNSTRGEIARKKSLRSLGSKFSASRRATNGFENFSYGKSLIVGFAQVFAIFPAISRSGTTLAAGLLTGLNEKNALRFSFLMSIPVIFGANILVFGTERISSSYVLPVLVSFFVGILSIHVLFKILETNRKNLRWFALYTLILAIGVLGYLIVG